MMDEDTVSNEELQQVTDKMVETLQEYEPITAVEIAANVLIRLGFGLDVDLVAQDQDQLLQVLTTAKSDKGETLATALVSQGLTMLTWTSGIEE